jgi:hypothetical protein
MKRTLGLCALCCSTVAGYEGAGMESLYPSNTDILRKAAAQGAVTGYVHALGAKPACCRFEQETSTYKDLLKWFRGVRSPLET